MLVLQMEKHPATQLFGHVIGHQLYDENDEQLKTRMNEVANHFYFRSNPFWNTGLLLQLDLLRRLRSEPASFWTGLVKKYFTSPHVAVVGIPSEKMVDQVSLKCWD